jgi:16S rRNA (cytosine967-C5)-methyltransferase
MRDARQIAFAVLERVEKDDAWASLALDAAIAPLNARDGAFCAALVYGVLERVWTLDWALAKHLSKPLKALRPPVLTALRLGAYQIFFMDSVPDRAAIHSAVALLKASDHAWAAGLANAVLRKCAATGLVYPPPDAPEYLTIRYSVQPWLAKMWIDAYGYAHAVGILDASLQRLPHAVRVNTLRTTPAALIAALADEGVAATPADLPDALRLAKGTAPQKTRAFADGLYHPQGLASQYCVSALAPQAGERILDVCAAPGGKSFTMALSGAQITALELHEHRAGLIRQGAARLGLENISVHCTDATQPPPEKPGTFDAVLCDVPCSGLGTLAKKPDIRRKTGQSLDNLPELQYTIMRNAVSMLASSGRLVYATCTLNPAENEAVCARFLADFPAFAPVTDFLPALPRVTDDKRFLTLLPHVHHCDGFFIAVFKKGQ